MPTLFTDDFPIVKNNTELQELFRLYPDYDPYYIAATSIADRREKFEKLYEKYHPYADSHFPSEVKKQFHQRTWEMYLGCALIERGIKFTSKDVGPDILIEEFGKRIWIECIACTKGEGKDRVPDLQYGVAQNVPDEEMIIRITSALKNKFEKYQKYVDKGIIKGEDCFNIAVNAGAFGHPEARPLILQSVFPIGHPTLSWSINNPQEKPVSGWTTRTFLTKKNGSPAPTTFFVDKEHAGISGAIYCKNNILNHANVFGEDILLVHNPQASNLLPPCKLDSFRQYKVDEKGNINL